MNAGKENPPTASYSIAPEIYAHNRSAPPPAQPLPSNAPPLVKPPSTDLERDASGIGESSALSIHASDILAVDDDDDSSKSVGQEGPKEAVSLPPTTPPLAPPLPTQANRREQHETQQVPKEPPPPPSTEQSKRPKSINSLLAGLSKKVSNTVERTSETRDDGKTRRTERPDLLNEDQEVEDSD